MSKRTCSIKGCGTAHYAKGWCRSHYQRWWRNGDPLSPALTHADPADAFQARTERDVTTGCLIWTGSKFPGGYGNIRVGGKNVYAHRYAWEQANGSIPEGKVIDHICHNRACVEATHLRPATASQNAWHREKAVTGSKTGVLNVRAMQGKFQVVMKRYGEIHHGGTYDTLEEAAIVAKEMRAELFGEFAGAALEAVGLTPTNPEPMEAP